MSLTDTPALTPALKRKRTEESPSSAPPKRLKVAFNETLQVQDAYDWNEKPLSLVREEVRLAILGHQRGDDGRYDSMKELLTTNPSLDDAPTTPLLRKYIVALAATANLGGRDCGGLLGALLDCHWMNRDNDFFTAFAQLMSNFVSTHTGYARRIFVYLIDKFANGKVSVVSISHDSPQSREEIFDRIHALIEHITHISPAALSILQSALVSHFPYLTDGAKAHINYTKNLLRLASKVPSLEPSILELITEKLVKIDVQIQSDTEDLEDDELDSIQNVIARLEEAEEKDDDIDDDSDDESDLNTTVDPEVSRLEGLRDSIAKLDVMLDLLFAYYDKLIERQGKDGKTKTFDQIIAVFLRLVLPTYSSRHAQFLFFRFGQASDVNLQKAIKSLHQVSFDRNQPVTHRISAISYLSCFITRAQIADRYVVREMFDCFSRELDRYRSAHENSTTGPEPHRYAPYYALMQAVLYIFSFRWRDFILDLDEDPDALQYTEYNDLNWYPPLKDTFAKHIHTRFNPLKVCNAEIVQEFARISHRLSLMYIYSILEANKRVRILPSAMITARGGALRETSLSSRLDEGSLRLEAYFPFDPYHLPRSKKWIEGRYVVWESPGGVEDEEDSQSSGEEKSGEEDENENGDGVTEESL